MLNHEEWSALVLSGQTVMQGADYHDIVVSTLARRRVMLDDALAQFATRAEALAANERRFRSEQEKVDTRI